MREWLQAYTLRSWTVYEIPLRGPGYRALGAASEESILRLLGGESPAAEQYWKEHHSVEGLLFYDEEQILGMGLDKAYGADSVRVLTKEWNGHAPGSLVLVVYKGIDASPRFVTVGVAAA